MNSLVLEGHLGKDAEVRTTPGGKEVTGFSVGCSLGWGENKRTVWMRCSLWGERGPKLAQYLLKGTHVIVVGTIDQGPGVWTDRDGTARASLDVTVRDVTLLGGGNRDAASDAGTQAPRTLDDVDDVPW